MVFATQVIRSSRFRIALQARPASHQIRRFHPTGKSPFISEVLHLSSDLLHGVHSVTGLPWVASIPLTAFIVRMTVALPLQVYSRIHARREGDLSPLLVSWGKHYQDKIRMRRPASGDQRLMPREARELLKHQMKERQMLLRKSWKVAPYWKPVNFLQIPVWLSLMEALRAMCGNDRGLLPYIVSLLGFSSGSTSTSYLPVEQSLASEGAFWFPNLLSGDPTGVLPLMLMLSILLNVTSGWKTVPIREISKYTSVEMLRHVVFRFLKFLIQILAVNVGFSSYVYEVPAGLMIYWIASSNVATLQSLFLDKYMFARPPLKPWVKMYVGIQQPRNG
jgi:mitochondrial inner membrane protein COX18